MAKGSAPVSRLSKEYNPNTLKKELDRISRAVNRVSAQNEDIDNRISREILAVRKSVDVAAQYQQLSYWTEWYEEIDAGATYIVAKLAFHSGWGAVADVQYRYDDFGNIDINEGWKGLESAGTAIQWVEDAGTEERNYPQGGYYRLRFIAPGSGVRARKISTQVQLRAVDRGNGVLVQESNTFDIDKLPDVMSLSLRVGTYDGLQWPVYATGQCDLDSLSVGIGFRSSIGTVNSISSGTVTSITFSTLSYALFDDDLISIGGVDFYVNNASGYSPGSGVVIDVDDGTGSGVTVATTIPSATPAFADWSNDDGNLITSGAGNNFNDARQDLSASNKNFDVYLGSFDSGVPVFVIALAYGELLNTGLTIDQLYQRATITTPQPEYAFDINTEIGSGDITAGMLAGAAQRAAIAITFAHKGTSTSDEDFLTYSGSIKWADGTTYNVSSNSFPETAEPTFGLWYIFHDPDSISDNNNTYNNITLAQRTTKLQLTSSSAIASQPTGRRILVGIYSPGKIAGEAAFFVSNTTVAITAPYIYTAKLSALSADLGQITAGTIGVNADVQWGAVSGTTDAPDDNATYGAIWPDLLGDVAATTAGTITSIVFNTLNSNVANDQTFTVNGIEFTANGTATAGTNVTVNIDSYVLASDIDDGTPAYTGGTLADVPIRFGEAPGATAGLYLTPTNLGYWTGSAWSTYMASNGDFFLSGTQGSLTWDQSASNLQINGSITLDRFTNGVTFNYDSNTFSSRLFRFRDDNVVGDVASTPSGSITSITFNTLERKVYGSQDTIIVGSDTFSVTADASAGTSVTVSVSGTSSGHTSGTTAYLESSSPTNLLQIYTLNNLVNLHSIGYILHDRGPLHLSSGGVVACWPSGNAFWTLTNPGVGITGHLTVGQVFPSKSDTGGYTLYSDGKAKVDGEFDATGQVNFSGLPTSSTGLSSGDLWSDAGTVKIV